MKTIYSLTYIQYEQFYSLDSSLENGNVIIEEKEVEKWKL